MAYGIWTVQNCMLSSLTGRWKDSLTKVLESPARGHELDGAGVGAQERWAAERTCEDGVEGGPERVNGHPGEAFSGVPVPGAKALGQLDLRSIQGELCYPPELSACHTYCL